MSDLRYCPGCKTNLPEGCFGNWKLGRAGLRTYCKNCTSLQGREYVALHPRPPKPETPEQQERHRATARAWQKKNKEYFRAHIKAWKKANPDSAKDIELRARFGISWDAFQAQFRNQKGRCAICLRGLDFKAPKRADRPVVDHDHKTGQVRGALCSNCNLMLGQAKDNPQILIAGASYLRDHAHK